VKTKLRRRFFPCFWLLLRTIGRRDRCPSGGPERTRETHGTPRGRLAAGARGNKPLFVVPASRLVSCTILVVCAGVVSRAADARTFLVGPGRDYQRPSEVAAIARDGDIVEIAAGVYRGDVAVWRQNHLTLRGVGGRAHLESGGRAADKKAIWVIKGQDTTIERIEFSGATVPDGNGAGIRPEGSGLVIRDCYFHDNENGILGGAGDIVIERSEFFRNGSGDGRTHNIYIGDRVHRFTLRYSYSHGARIGHNVKSRARENHIEYNRIMDEVDGTASYIIDMPNGGTAYVIGNLIQQGPQAENLTIVSYGVEGLIRKRNEIYFINNTVVNDAPKGTFISIADGTQRTVVVNNLFVGPGHRIVGKVDARHNLSLNDAGLIDREHYDYRLTAGSPAIDAGIDPGEGNGVVLMPRKEYRDPMRVQARPSRGQLDVGAYEFDPKNAGMPNARP
jgi:hypothetical protein